MDSKNKKKYCSKSMICSFKRNSSKIKGSKRKY